MKKHLKSKALSVIAASGIMLVASQVQAEDTDSALVNFFKDGSVSGQIKTYYFAQSFDGDGLNNSQIWVNGGNLNYKTAELYGVKLGTTFQASFVGYKNDDDGKTAGTMDADGAVLSEAYLQYSLDKTSAKVFRQYMNTPLLKSSGSRMIKESFEAYQITNTNIPGTTVTAAYVDKYQTRTDKVNYADNWFVDFDEFGTGKPGDFYTIGDNGSYFIYLKNTTVEGLEVQAQYLEVVDEVGSFYGDAKYTLDAGFRPYLAVQYLYSSYEQDEKSDNDLLGFKTGLNVSDFNFFAAFTTTGGDEGDAGVFRGIGQGANAQFTFSTKTAGKDALTAGTDAYQVGAGYKYEDRVKSTLKYTRFDAVAENGDLDEYNLEFLYTMHGWAEGFSLSVDVSYLDYENDQKDATDLRTRLIYSF